jgi:hypothetical protein
MFLTGADYAIAAAATRDVRYHSSMFAWHSVSRDPDSTASLITNSSGVALLCDI